MFNPLYDGSWSGMILCFYPDNDNVDVYMLADKASGGILDYPYFWLWLLLIGDYLAFKFWRSYNLAFSRALGDFWAIDTFPDELVLL